WKRAADAPACPNQTDCTTFFNDCNGHGTCLPDTNGCHSCKCTKDAKGVWWGGESCQYIDYSVDFHLFFWLVLTLILGVVLATSAIVRMGYNSESEYLSFHNF